MDDQDAPSCMDQRGLECEKASDLATVLRIATSTERGKGKHPHQRRIPPDKLKKFCDELSVRESELEGFGHGSFDKLYNKVERIGRPIDGIGDLAMYDVAKRIGFHLQVKPGEVYLQSGAKEGARRATGEGSLKRTIPRSKLPKALRDSPLDNFGLEVFLCVCKDEINKSTKPPKTCSEIRWGRKSC